MGSRFFSRICAGLAFLVLALPAARADDAITPPKIDLTRWNDQPVYPDGAVAKNEQGNTVLAVSIDTRSRVTKIEVDKSSGYDDLDQTAIAAAKQFRYDAATDGHKNIPGVMKLTIHIQLAPLPKPPITEADIYALKEIGDLIVCKTPPPALGSNITPKSVCRTKREWDAMTKQGRDQNIPDRPRGPFLPN